MYVKIKYQYHLKKNAKLNKNLILQPGIILLNEVVYFKTVIEMLLVSSVSFSFFTISNGSLPQPSFLPRGTLLWILI